MTLKEIEDAYERRMKKSTSPLSFEEYLREKGNGYESEIDEKRHSLLTAAGKLEGRNEANESLLSRGLISSGYASYLKEKRGDGIATALKELSDEEATLGASAKRGYLAYIESHDKRQAKLRESVIRGLTEAGELNAEKIYDYAAARGLSGKAARGLYEAVYSALRTPIRNDILGKLYKNELTPETALAYARARGLNKEDTADIERLAKKYQSGITSYGQSYRDYLESLAAQNTMR